MPNCIHLLTARQAHGVEGRSADFVLAQLIDGVLPQREAGAALGQHEGDARQRSRPRRTLVMQQHRHAGVDQAPVVLAAVLVQVGQRRTDEDLMIYTGGIYIFRIYFFVLVKMSHYIHTAGEPNCGELLSHIIWWFFGCVPSTTWYLVIELK